MRLVGNSRQYTRDDRRESSGLAVTARADGARRRFFFVGWNKLRAVPAVEMQNLFELPELRGACSSLLPRRLKNSQPLRIDGRTRPPCIAESRIRSLARNSIIGETAFTIKHVSRYVEETFTHATTRRFPRASPSRGLVSDSAVKHPAGLWTHRVQPLRIAVRSLGF